MDANNDFQPWGFEPSPAKPIEHYTEMIRGGVPWSMSRWGDGEWQAVIGRVTGSNCDHHDYSPAMTERLTRVLLDKPTYTLGLQPLAWRLFTKKIHDFVVGNGLQGLDWIVSDTFHVANMKGRLDGFTAAVRDNRPVIIGPPHLKPMVKKLDAAAFVEVPPKNCFDRVNNVIKEATRKLLRVAKGRVVSVSASMPAEIVVHELFRRFGDDHTFVDLGSLWDVYVGVRSRKYMLGMRV